MYGLHIIDVTVIVIYLIGITIAGLWASRKARDFGGFFMGNRSFGKFFMLMHAFGTGTHTDQAVSIAGASYRLGFAGIWYQYLNLFLTPFYWIVAPLLRRMRCLTTADFFVERFGKSLGIFYTISGLVIFAFTMGLMLLGTGKTASAITDGAISAEVAIAIMTVLFLSYGLVGGLPAAIITDFIQGLFIIVLSFLLVPYVLVEAGGFSELHRVLPPEMFSLLAPGEPPAGYDRITVFYIFIIVVNGLVGTIAAPHHMAIGGAGKTEYEVRFGFTYGNMVKRFCTVAWTLIGVACIAIYPGLDDPEHAWGLATRQLLPVGLIGVMLASMIAGVMSSCDSFMVDGAALFVENIYRPYINPDASESRLLNVGRIVGVLVVGAGLYIGIHSDSVIYILVLGWSLSAFFGIAVWGGVIWRRCNTWGAWAGILTAIGLWTLTRFHLEWELQYQFVLYLSGGFLAMIVVSLLTPRQDQAQLDRFYTILHTPVGEEHKLREAGIKVILE